MSRRGAALAGPSGAAWTALIGALVDRLADVSVCVTDADHRFVHVHGAWPEMAFAAGDLLGRPVSDAVADSTLGHLTPALDRALAGSPSTLELEPGRVAAGAAPGRRRTTRVGPIPAPDGTRLVLWTAPEIAARCPADVVRETDGARFRMAFHHASVPMALVTVPPGAGASGGALSCVNDAFAELLGRAPGEHGATGPLPDLPLPYELAPELVEMVQSVLDGCAEARLETSIRRADGQDVRIRAAGSPAFAVPGTDGRLHRELLITLHDRTSEDAARTALSAALEAERLAADRWRRLDAIRDDFVSAVSHELRTPLTSILAGVEMLMDGDGGPLAPMQAHLLAPVEAEAQRLRRLIENLLTVRRLQEGSPGEPERRIVDLASVASLAVREVDGQIRRRAQRLHPDLRPGSFVHGDAEQLCGAIAELLSNASTVSPVGGSIHLSCAAGAEQIVVRVTDSGPGIADHELPHVFGRFYRTAHAGREALPGTGLGLALVHHVITSHGGSVSASSTPSGAVLALVLPAATPPVGPDDRSDTTLRSSS